MKLISENTTWPRSTFGLPDVDDGGRRMIVSEFMTIKEVLIPALFSPSAEEDDPRHAAAAELLKQMLARFGSSRRRQLWIGVLLAGAILALASLVDFGSHGGPAGNCQGIKGIPPEYKSFLAEAVTTSVYVCREQVIERPAE